MLGTGLNNYHFTGTKLINKSKKYVNIIIIDYVSVIIKLAW